MLSARGGVTAVRGERRRLRSDGEPRRQWNDRVSMESSNSTSHEPWILPIAQDSWHRFVSRFAKHSEARRALIKKSTLGLLRDVRFRGDVASRVSDHDARGRDGRPLVRQAPRDEIFARIEAQVLEGVA